METKSAISCLGIAVIFPHMVSEATKILKALQERPTSKVSVLHYEQRVLSAHEAILVYHRVDLWKLSSVGGGFDIDSLKNGFKIFCERIQLMQDEKVGLIAFDDTHNLGSKAICSIVKESTTKTTSLDSIPDFDCATGAAAADFKTLLSEGAWMMIEQKAKYNVELAC